MRAWLKISAMGITAVLLLTPVLYAAECNSRCCEEEYPKLIVQGEGKIEALADKAYFNIRLRQEEKKLERAFEESAKKINAINGILTSAGIKKEDIRNLGYIYHPLYEGKPLFSTLDRPTSYEILYNLKVTTYDLDKLGKILAGLADIPETSVSGLTYTSTKIEQLKRDALKEAASDARQKALKLAEGSGAALGKALKIESRSQAQFLRGEIMEQRMDYAMMKSAKPAPQIESGYLEISADCTVIYTLQ